LNGLNRTSNLRGVKKGKWRRGETRTEELGLIKVSAVRETMDGELRGNHLRVEKRKIRTLKKG